MKTGPLQETMWMHCTGNTFRDVEGIWLTGNVCGGTIVPSDDYEIYCIGSDTSFKVSIKKIMKSRKYISKADADSGSISILTDLFMVLFSEDEDLIIYKTGDKERALAAFKGETAVSGSSAAKEAATAAAAGASIDYNRKQEIQHNEVKPSTSDPNGNETSGETSDGGTELLRDKRVKIALTVIAVLALLLAGIMIGKAAFGGFGDHGEDSAATDEDGSAEYSDDEYLANAVEYNGHHYQTFDDSMYWNEAKEECESMGGHLLTIESADEQEKIEEIIENAGTGKKHYWLGGTSEDGSWKWLNGDSIPMPSDNWGYQNWESGKPNNNTKAAGYTGREAYLELQTTSSGKEYMTWNDIDMDGVAIGYENKPEYNSTQYFGYICEWDY